MNFLRLPDPLLKVLFENEDIIAIDKPYGFNAHTNDSKIAHSDFIQDGLIEIFEKQRKQKLHIVHRLDQTTTGVMIFGKSMESAKKYAEFFLNRQVKKTYIFITKSKSTKVSYSIDQAIIHKGRELEAKTDLFLLKKSKNFELWKAKPFTGRNHQIRIHARAAGLPILGDEKYEGARYPFLNLHNQQIEFPNGIVIASKSPLYYDELDLLENIMLSRSIFEIDRRLRLFSISNDTNQCCRLVHNLNRAKDPGYTLDQYGNILVLNWHKDFWSEHEELCFDYISKWLGKPILFTQKPEQKDIPSAWVVKENNIKFELRNVKGAGPGLLTNQRLHRIWLKKNSQGKNVLILFANSGGYSLAAAIGGAAKVTSVEFNKNHLSWIKKNFELNNFPSDQHKFYFRDSIGYIEQCANKKISFDIIVCETPSFFRKEKGIFKIEKDLEIYLKNCLSCLNENGQFLFLTQSEDFLIDDINKIFLKIQKDLKIKKLEINSILPTMDYELPNDKVNLKSFIINNR